MRGLRSFVGDIGTKITLDVGFDISDSTVRKIKYEKPDGTTGEWPSESGDNNCELASSTSIYYITQEGDLDQAGEWVLQSYVETPNWGPGHGQKVVVPVDTPIT